MLSGGHLGFHAPMTVCHGLKKAPSDVFKDMVKLRLSKFVRAYRAAPGLNVDNQMMQVSTALYLYFSAQANAS